MPNGMANGLFFGMEMAMLHSHAPWCYSMEDDNDGDDDGANG